MTFGVDISYCFLIHWALKSLYNQFGQLKAAYNASTEKLELNEISPFGVEEEGRFNSDR